MPPPRSVEPHVPRPIPCVTAARLVLRAPRMEDFEPFARNAADPKAWVHLGGPLDRREAFRRFLNMTGHWLLQGMGWWTIEEGDRPVGSVGVFVRECRPDVEIGWTIHRPYWGKGFAPEAAAAARDHAFAKMGVKRMIAIIAHRNTPSIRVAEKIGMRADGEIDFYGESSLRYVAEA